MLLVIEEQVMKKGIVQVYTGNGKGKTTAAIGQAMRAVGHGWKVAMVQFMKGREYGELKSTRCIDGFSIEQYGRDEFVNPKNTADVDIDYAMKGWQRAEELVAKGEVDLLILDEINVAVSFGLIPIEKVTEFIVNKPEELDLILTGRYAPEEILELADTITEMKEIKHHYNNGVQAREGIEY